MFNITGMTTSNDGTDFYLKDGKFHNLLGPAIYNEILNYTEFYVEGIKYSENEFFDKFIKKCPDYLK